MFENRFENGYDLYVDPDYNAWLRIYHPSSLPEELSGATPNVKSSGLEGEMELGSLSQNSPLQSTPIQDEHSDLIESLAQDSPVEQQNMTQAKSSEVSSGSPLTSPSDSSTPLRQRSSAITEFLTPPFVTSKKAKGKGKAPGGGRVLTSDDSLALLQEKEKKTKDEEEAKLKRKLEREEKRAAKEVENKRKKEERERKLTERKLRNLQRNTSKGN